MQRRRKQGQTVKEDFRNVAWAWMDGVRKDKVQLKLRSAAYVKSNEKSFCCDISSENMNKEKRWIIAKWSWSFNGGGHG